MEMLQLSASDVALLVSTVQGIAIIFLALAVGRIETRLKTLEQELFSPLTSEELSTLSQHLQERGWVKRD